MKKGLGRGLEALLQDNSREETADSGVTMLRLSEIEPNRDQPRKRFDAEPLEELSASIAEHGLISPIIVRRKDNGFYEIIAGERRWRASKMAGLSEIPVIVRAYDDEDAALVSLIENLHRKDLNPVEEARGYRELMENFDLTQEEASKKVGKSRVAVANILRILRLPDTVLPLVEDGSLTYGHARTILPLADVCTADEMAACAENVIKNGLSVRDTEKYVKNYLANKQRTPEDEKKPEVSNAYYQQLEARAGDRLGRHATINRNRKGGGAITLAYADADDLERLLKSICGNDFFEE